MPVTAKVLLLGYGAALIAAALAWPMAGFWPAVLIFWIGGAVATLIAAAILTSRRRAGREAGGGLASSRPERGGAAADPRAEAHEAAQPRRASRR
ncbi:hypothetical protein SAMN05421538_102396 [Paracoccus isoporae]|uniref:Uncharacterized protein n=1 Tax=Paracoccus isoporae TaxID=591205 RepID=A0A1G6XG73_9RHOB|nr:hypothetical protein [Paracoccus isoporae]SDD77219.1 hypothetical protein SAMN05421538_102396 [Paracoccus isoporae]